jgi:hypothetical protein
MKKPLLLAGALVVMGFALQMLGGIGAVQTADAAPANSVRISRMTCLSPDRVSVEFAWNSSGQGIQWLDLSLFNNNFAPGTFLGAGPMASGQNTLVWDGLLANTTHYVRVNTFTSQGWEASLTYAFNTAACNVAYSGASSYHLDVQSCLPNGLVRINLDWLPSQQGIQFADFSLSNNGFFPGTFAGIGAMPPNQNSLTVDNMSPNTTYFSRLNTLTPGGWIATPTIAFTTGTCQPSNPFPDFNTDTKIVNGSATGQNPAVLTDVRVGAHPEEGWDRIVFEFSGNLPDSTRIRYEASAVQCGSGMTEDVAGSGTLIVHMTDARAHNDMGQVTVGDTDVDGTGAAIREAVQICDFEGVVDWAVGTAGQQPFRVTVLSNPGRIVIDVLR